MTWTSRAGAGWVARRLLLACTLFGLAAMHTLGHAGMHEATAGPTGAHNMVERLVPQVALAATTGGDSCTGDGCTHLVPQSGGGGGMAGWSVCVAVLTGFAVLLLLTVLLWRAVSRRDPPGPRRGSGAGTARGPPVQPLGLLLAAASVLRI